MAKITLRNIIARHREIVLEREDRKTKKIEAKLRKQSTKTAASVRFQKQLKEQKGRQVRAKFLTKKLNEIKRAPLKAKATKARAASKQFGKKLGKGAKNIGRGLVDFATELDKGIARNRVKPKKIKKKSKLKLKTKKKKSSPSTGNRNDVVVRVSLGGGNKKSQSKPKRKKVRKKSKPKKRQGRLDRAFNFRSY